MSVGMAVWLAAGRGPNHGMGPCGEWASPTRREWGTVSLPWGWSPNGGDRSLRGQMGP